MFGSPLYDTYDVPRGSDEGRFAFVLFRDGHALDDQERDGLVKVLGTDRIESEIIVEGYGLPEICMAMGCERTLRLPVPYLAILQYPRLNPHLGYHS